MPSKYPGAIESFPSATELVATAPMNGSNVQHAALHNKINENLVAIQKELGINPRGSSESVAARLATFAPATHTHTTAQVSGLDAALALRGTGLASAPGTALASSAAVGTSTLVARQDHVHPLPTLSALGAAASSHTHTTADIPGLQDALDGKALASTEITAGAGLTGGGTLGSAVTLSVSFAGTGTATTAARSDHNHTGVYSPANHNHDTVYIKQGAVGATSNTAAKAAPPVVVEQVSSANASAPSTPAAGLPVGTIAAIWS